MELNLNLCLIQSIFQYLIKLFISKNYNSNYFYTELDRFVESMPVKFIFHDKYYDFNLESFIRDEILANKAKRKDKLIK